MNSQLIPALDPTPIPGPEWLFQGLLVFTFILHLLFMNLTLGGTILAAIARLTARGGEDDHRSALADRLVTINTFGISLTITTGIAPLLFVQVLFPQFFYTATILLGWIWFALLVSLMVGYYAVYAYKFGRARAARSRAGGAGWLVAAAVLFLLVAMTQVAVNLIHAQPEGWADFARSPLLVLGDGAYWPRLLHFVLAALSLSAGAIAWWSVRQAGKGIAPDLNGRMARYAWRWLLWATVAQIAGGFVLLMVLPAEVMSGFMRGGAATLVPLGLAILLGLGLLMMLARVTEPVEEPGAVTGTLAALTLAIAIMAVTRHQIRTIYLAPFTDGLVVPEAAQWGNFLLFAVLLVAGLATVAFMVRRVLAARVSAAG